MNKSSTKYRSKILTYMAWFSAIILSLFFVNENFNPNFSIMNPALVHHEKVKLVGHRGAAGLAPENSMAAVRKAIELNTPYIELDLQQPKDGVVMVMHDSTLNRTTNGKGKIREKYWEEIKDLEVGSHFSEDYSQEKVPNLEQILELIKSSSSTLIIEVKHPEHYPGMLSNISSVLDKTGTRDRVVIISFDIPFIKSVQANYPDLRVGCLYVKLPRNMDSVPKDIEFVSVHWINHLFYMKRARRYQSSGIEVWIWTVNSKKMINKLIKKGIDGITTDFPNLIDPLNS